MLRDGPFVDVAADRPLRIVSFPGPGTQDCSGGLVSARHSLLSLALIYFLRGAVMAKAYWVAFYHSIKNPDALAAYAKLAGPAVQAAGGRFLARGTAAKVYERGIAQRVVIIEFDSVAQATAAHDGPGYQEALKVLGKDAVERDLRIVEGV
jgi:uncharacterized protein (DUF1330 family)